LLPGAFSPVSVNVGNTAGSYNPATQRWFGVMFTGKL
jgi:hypothetical protein